MELREKINIVELEFVLMRLILWFIVLFSYIYIAYCLQIIARKTGTENSWFAWVPILNIYLMCKIARKPGWWVIFFIIPIVNIVVGAIVWMEIAEHRNKDRILGLLAIVPVVNFVALYYIASE